MSLSQTVRSPDNQPLVSVVIATYNMASYLAAAVRSVLAQTYPNLEVHVVDDGSTDETQEVLQAFRTDPRVVCHRLSKSGQPAAKNKGILASTGALVAFCDADDMWLPDKLSLQVPAFDPDGRVGVVYSKSLKLDQSEQQVERIPERVYPSGHVTSQLFIENFVPFGTAVVRRECLEELGNFDERYQMGIDWDLWLRISTKYEFRFVDAVTYVYRVWPGQMSKDWRGRYDHAFRIMEDFTKTFPDAISPRIHRMGLADSYANRARYRSTRSGEHLDALKDAAHALWLAPTYKPAWRVPARVVLNALSSSSTARLSIKEQIKLSLLPITRRATITAPRILMYHRFAPGRYFRRLSVTAFERHLRYLTENYRVRRLDAVVAALQEGRPFEPNTVVLTVDDGYRDFIEYAYPLLQRYRVPATFYVVSDFLDGSIWLWFDALHYIVHAAKPGTYFIATAGKPISVELVLPPQRNVVWEQLADFALELTPAERTAYVRLLSEALQVAIPPRPTHDYCAATWDELKALDPDLIDIGSQTRTHPILANCSREQLIDEISGSKAMLERHLGRSVTAFSYPNGRRRDISAEAVEIVQQSGYTSAAVWSGTFVTSRSNPYLLERLGAPAEPVELAIALGGAEHLRLSMMRTRAAAGTF